MKEQVRKYKKWREYITRGGYVFLISVPVFSALKIQKEYYLGFLAILWLMLFVNYSPKRNYEFYQSAAHLCFVNLAAYVAVKCLQCRPLHLDLVHILYGMYGLGLVFFWNWCSRKEKEAETQAEEERHRLFDDLFKERKYDLDKILQYLDSLDMIGINAPWGNGKTYLMNALKEQLKKQEKYVFIEINLLSCNLDEIQGILLNEMEKALFEHRIFSKYSRKMKKLLGEKGLVGDIGSFLVSNDMAFSEAIAGFQREIRLLDKTMVIIYEDIDRIHDAEMIKKIFSISENLSGGRIKIIYQYDEENLEQMDAGLERNYLEKYIPFTIQLTEIEFHRILSYLLDKNQNYDGLLTREDFKHLELPIYADYEIQKTLDLEVTLNMKLRGVTIRKVEHFLQELYVTLKNHAEYGKEKYKKDVITLLFLKHFMYPLYKQIKPGQGLLDTFCLEYRENQYTVPELLYFYETKNPEWNQQDIKEILNDPHNKNILAVISLFKYRFGVHGGGYTHIEDITDQSVKNLTDQEYNEEKDRLIWNLVCNGESEYSNHEIAVNKLCEMVLEKPEAERKAAFRKFWDMCYHGDFEKAGSSTIFLFGVSVFETLFQAFRIAGATREQWLAFLDFYFTHEKIRKIDLQLIGNLNYCNLNSRDVYLYVLERFNQLEVVGNMNAHKSYLTFLKNYLQALSSLQYVNTYEAGELESVWKKEMDHDAMEMLQEMVLEPIQHRLEKEAEALETLPEICRDIRTILAFIQKNIEIMNMPNNCQVPRPKWKTEMHSSLMHQEEFDNLSKLDLPDEEYWKTVGKSYKEGKIGAYEIQKLPRIIRKEEKNHE